MQIETNSNIGELIRTSEDNFVSGVTTMSKYVTENIYEDINKIDAYLNSKHVSGETDSLGRPKPFFNICLASRNIWFRATDLDRKEIRIKATKRADVLTSFLANAKLQEWMIEDNFGQWLNDWGIGLAGYGSYISKWVEQEGNLYAMTIPWQRIICDSIDFVNNPKIEVLELTPAQLRKRKGYDQEMVKNLIDTVSSRELTDGQKKDNVSDYIKLYEVHGELPLSWLTDDGKDDNEYVQQMQVVSFLKGTDGKYNDFTLYRGKEEQDPYYITHLLKKDGYTLSDGSVKSLFQAQWMMNHTAKAIKDQLDVASKIFFQTSDGSFIGQNALTSLENGQIFIHKINEPLTKLNNQPDITSLQSFGNQWKALSNEIDGISESMLGDNPPSGTAYRQTEMLLAESHSLFKIMKQNKALALEEQMRKYIIPYLKKKLDTTDEIVATLDTFGIDKIDEIYLKNEPIKRTNNRLVEEVIRAGERKRDMPTTEEQAQMMQEETSNVLGELKDMGSQRFIKPSDMPDKTWKDIFKNFEWGATVEITDENSNKDTVLTTLNSFISLFANPNITQAMQTNPAVKIAINKLLNATGELSQLELSELNKPSMPQSQQVMAQAQ